MPTSSTPPSPPSEPAAWQTGTEILAGVARRVWPLHIMPGTDCPDDRIPTPATLLRWMATWPDHDVSASDRDIESFTVEIETHHREYIAAKSRGEAMRHPLAEIVQAWLKQPIEGLGHGQSNGLLPEGFLKRKDDGTTARTVNLVPLAYANLPDDLARVKGSGADIARRLYYLAPLLMDIACRFPGITIDWTPTVRDLAVHLWPDGKGGTSYRADRNGAELTKGLTRLNFLGAPVSDGFWIPAIVRKYPDPRDLGSSALIQYQMPVAADRGPKVNLRFLERMGKRSDTAHDLYLGLCSIWDRAKLLNRYSREKTFPVYARIEQPPGSGQWVRHRAADLVPLLDGKRLAELSHPHEIEGASSSQLKNWGKRARVTLREMEATGFIHLEWQGPRVRPLLRHPDDPLCNPSDPDA